MYCEIGGRQRGGGRKLKLGSMNEPSLIWSEEWGYFGGYIVKYTTFLYYCYYNFVIVYTFVYYRSRVPG